MKTKTLIPFLAISFGLTWGLAALLFMFYDQMVAIFGEIEHEQSRVHPCSCIPPALLAYSWSGVPMVSKA